MARPSKFSQDTADRILSALRAGNTRTASALYVGVDYSTLKRWSDRNAEFRAALDRAEAEAEVRYVAVLAKAANEGDTGAAKWWLERRRSEDWRERKELQHTGKDGESLSALSDDDLDAQIAAYQARTRTRAQTATGAGEAPISD